MKVVTNVLKHLDPRYGGISTSVPLFCSLASDEEFKEELAAFSADDEEPEIVVSTERFPNKIHQWAEAQNRARFIRTVNRADILHIHGLWQDHFLAATLAGVRQLKPILVSPHGMLDDWALRQKRLKKLIFSRLLQRPLLNKATCLRALTESEAQDIKHYGVHLPIAVIPNGVTVPASIDPNAFFDHHPELRNANILTFLGRLHKKKGLELLCRSWIKIAKKHPAAHLVIAGPSEDGTAALSNALIADAGLEDRVTFTGPLKGSAKWSLLAASSAFVLPSLSEGFSIAVLEALSVGTPVILSKHCHLPEAERNGCGWTVDLNEDILSERLSHVLNLSTAEYQDTRLRASTFAKANYSWSRIATLTKELYRWALDGQAPQALQIV